MATISGRTRPLEILMVDDNPGDVDLLAEALRSLDFPHNLSSVTDGAEAMAYLRRRDIHAGVCRPDLIFLDLNMPRKGGREVLTELKADPDLRQIPVLIFTSSEYERDIAGTSRSRANAYLRKPDDFQGYGKVVQTIEELWHKMVERAEWDHDRHDSQDPPG